MEAWLNQNIPSKVRATVISMSGQTGEIGALGSSTGLVHLVIISVCAARSNC